MSPEKTAQKQTGRFRPGESGNPAGRPRGALNRVTRAAMELLNGEAHALTRIAVERALEGDMTALRLCLERILPVCRERVLDVNLPVVAATKDLPLLTAAILEAVASGSLTPSEGEKLTGIVANHARTIETAEFEARLSALEADHESD